MNLSSRGFITRPVAAALMMVAVVTLGIVSYVLLPVAALPNIDTPTIQVTAQIPGADPGTILRPQSQLSSNGNSARSPASLK